MASNQSAWARLFAACPVYRRFVAGVVFSTVVVVSAGCQMTPNVYHDEMATTAPVTTPSARGIREAGVPPLETIAQGSEKSVRPVSGTVFHGPLYFEDPTNEYGSDDGQFAVTNEDFNAFFATPFRFLVNADFYPISLLVTPPCMTMASDGVASREICCGTHDATPVPRPTG